MRKLHESHRLTWMSVGVEVKRAVSSQMASTGLCTAMRVSSWSVAVSAYTSTASGYPNAANSPDGECTMNVGAGSGSAPARNYT